LAYDADMPQAADLLHSLLLGNTPRDWLLAALIFLLTLTVLPLVRGYLRARRTQYESRELPAAFALIAHLLQRTSRFVLWIVALYLAERILTLPRRVDRAFDVAIVLGCWLQLGIWTSAAVRFWLERQQGREGDGRLSGSLDVVLFIARLLVWILVILLALGNLGVNVTGLVAGLGVGGIAIALAVQTILGDLFASLSIALDKPFIVGDLLRIDDYEGTVEQIGIKSTRLRSVAGEQIIVANADLLKSRVRNMGRMNERRALFTLSIAYETPQERLTQLPSLVAEAVAAVSGARFVHCLLKELGQSALLFEVCFFVGHRTGREIGVAIDTVNRQLLRSFADAGIEFAYPTRTVRLMRVRTDPVGNGS
jgi:small-conductance mechanosensitive channel